ncbi:MAG TPA: radical SAM family heme chaperone HemW [Bacteroidales bacterium]|nr:radical SAM family heme chaperone HemW [Bacteroidales bacterium]
MAGIYIHIPFCKKKCHYCNFYSLASNRYFDEIIDAIALEIPQRKNLIGNNLIESIYFGGGTPSLMGARHLQKIMTAIYQNFTISENAEITLEANPDDLSIEKLKAFKENKINRLSIGIQTFNDHELKYLNRTHDAKKAIESIEMARESGFNNLTVDLIYGLPDSTSESWSRNLQLIRNLDIPHLSCYALTVEPNTAFEYFIRKGQLKPPEEELFLNQFEQLIDFTAANGYEHYEISNFCRNGLYARHNTAYWFGAPYLGLGPSAHSFDGNSRFWNIAHLKKYMDGIAQNMPVFEQESLTQKHRYNEFVMTRLRTFWGIGFADLQKDFGEELSGYFFDRLKKYKDSEVLEISATHVRLSRKGIFISDNIISDFFAEE